ncbi:MAG: S49 family peptidase [Hyphomicrobium sp.]|uniref:S49 family peptidase n=1 Tax=Hyphomicrobium sp. TaxID=82 RepID=UPI003D128B75
MATLPQATAARDYARALSLVFGQPLAVAPNRAVAMVRALEGRLGVGSATLSAYRASPRRRLRAYATRDDDDEPRPPYVVTPAGIALVGIHGTLVHKAMTAAPPSGFMAYDEARTAVRAAAMDPQVRALLLDIDSPGGQVGSSLPALAADVRRAAQVKPVWAVADDLMCSAAYWIGSAAQRIYVPREGRAGSIGIIAMHLDQSAFNEKQGFRFTTIYAGARKNDLSPHKPLSQREVDDLQARVDRIYETFLAAVGQHRPALGAAGARATEAAVFSGADAVRVRLADAVGDFDTALSELTAALSYSQGRRVA